MYKPIGVRLGRRPARPFCFWRERRALLDHNDKMPRRQFLTAAGLSSAALLTGEAFGATGSTNDLGQVGQPLFAPQVGTTFQFTNKDGDTATLTLVAATQLPKATRKRAKRIAFSLLFQGSLKPILPDGMYNINHPKLGTFSGVFLGYVGPGKKNDYSYYEAIFN